MRKLTVKMSYTGDKIEGQGVGAATKEQIALIRDQCQAEFNVLVNKRGKHDILHVHTIDPMGFLRMHTTHAPIVMHVHFLPETLEGSIKLPRLFMKIFQMYFLSMYRKADAVVVVNPIFIEPLTEYNIKREKIHYIPNFVSEEEFYPDNTQARSELRQKYQIDEDTFVVLGVGQVQTRKGVLDFIEVAKKMPHIQFIWLGGFSFGAITDGYKKLKAIIDNPPANVIFTDIIPRSEMNAYYNMGDLLFMPSYNELFPMALLEACSSGLPILLRDLDLYEVILFESYAKAATIDEYIEWIEELSTSSSSYNKQKEVSARISAFYSRANIRRQWIEFYQSLITNKN